MAFTCGRAWPALLVGALLLAARAAQAGVSPVAGGLCRTRLSRQSTCERGQALQRVGAAAKHPSPGLPAPALQRRRPRGDAPPRPPCPRCLTPHPSARPSPRPGHSRPRAPGGLSPQGRPHTVAAGRGRRAQAGRREPARRATAQVLDGAAARRPRAGEGGFPGRAAGSRGLGWCCRRNAGALRAWQLCQPLRRQARCNPPALPRPPSPPAPAAVQHQLPPGGLQRALLAADGVL
jgi:hypothetical protein